MLPACRRNFVEVSCTMWKVEQACLRLSWAEILILCVKHPSQVCSHLHHSQFFPEMQTSRFWSDTVLNFHMIWLFGIRCIHIRLSHCFFACLQFVLEFWSHLLFVRTRVTSSEKGRSHLNDMLYISYIVMSYCVLSHHEMVNCIYKCYVVEASLSWLKRFLDVALCMTLNW